MSSEELCQQWKSHSRLAKVDLMLFRFKKEKSKIRIAWGNQNLAEFWQNCFSGLSALESCELQERIQRHVGLKGCGALNPPLVAPVTAPVQGCTRMSPGCQVHTALQGQLWEGAEGGSSCCGVTAGPCRALRLQLLTQESGVTCYTAPLTSPHCHFLGDHKKIIVCCAIQKR